MAFLVPFGYKIAFTTGITPSLGVIGGNWAVFTPVVDTLLSTAPYSLIRNGGKKDFSSTMGAFCGAGAVFVRCIFPEEYSNIHLRIKT